MCRDGTPGRTESPVGCRSADTVNDPRGKAGATIWPNSVGAAQPRLARSSTRLTRERVPPDPAAGRWASVSGIRVAFRLNALPGASRPAGCPGVKLPRAAKVASWPGNLPASLPFPTCFGCERHRGSVGSGVLRIRWGANGGRRRQGALPSPPHRHHRTVTAAARIGSTAAATWSTVPAKADACQVRRSVVKGGKPCVRKRQLLTATSVE
jgi:hypothetical protein